MKIFILINKSKLDIFYLFLCKNEDITLGITHLCTMSAYILKAIP